VSGPWQGGGGPRRVWPIVAGVLVLIAVGVVALDRLAPGVLETESDAMRLVYLALLMLIIGPALFIGPLARNIRYLLVWAGVAAALVLGYSFWQQGRISSATVEGELLPQRDSAGQPGEARFVANASGDFVVTARVEGARVRFLVDTGATDVVLTRADALRVGFDTDSLHYSRAYSTANGTVFAAPVRLARVALGGVTVHDVAGSVADGELEISLLGSSFLSRLSGYEVRDGVLTLYE
jgi:aspartyl protease family protein